MKKLLCPLSLCACVLTGCYPSNVLDKVPDGEFQKYLVDKFDNNGDHTITRTEASMVTEMYANGEFETVEGIKYFENLEHFDQNCAHEKVLDLSRNKFLRKVDLMNMRNLTILKCNDDIEEIILARTPLEKLTLGNMKWLTWIVCIQSQLTELNVETAPILQKLNVQHNNLTELDLSRFPLLEECYCENNRLKVLDVSQNPHLRVLRTKENKNLREIWLKTGQQIKGINLEPDYRYCLDNDVEIKYKN